MRCFAISAAAACLLLGLTGIPSLACTEAPPDSGVSAAPPLPADQIARSYYRSPAQYLVVAKIVHVYYKEDDGRGNVLVDVEILHTIRGPAPLHANRLWIHRGQTSMCEQGGPDALWTLLVGVDESRTIPIGRWWDRPSPEVLEELQQLGKRRNGA